MQNKHVLLYSRFILLVLVLSGIRANATTYYISGSGDDSKSGTSPANAWLSLSKISGISFSAGDQVLLQGSVTFNGTINLTGVVGTAANPIVFSSYGTGKATVSSGTNSGFYALNSAGLVIKNIVFAGSGYTLGTATGVYFRNALAAGIKLDYVMIDSIEVSGYNMNGITWTGVNSLSGFGRIRITHSKVHDNGNGIVSGGVNVKTGYNITSWANSDVYIAYCEVYNNYGSPEVTNTHTGDGILIRSTNKLLIEHCVSYNNGSEGATYAGAGCVGIWCTQCNNVVIQYCESHHIHSGSHVDGDGFDIDGANTNAVLQYNYAHDNDGAGFLIYQYDNAGRMDSVTIRYNISENDSRNSNMGGIHINSGDNTAGGGVNHALIYNNTVYLVPTSIAGAAAIVAKGTINELTVANNIIQTTGGVPLVGNINTIPGNFVGNLYWSSGSAFSIKWKNVPYSSLSAWQAASNQEAINGHATGIVADPLLLNPGKDILVGDTDSLAIKLNKYYTISNTSPAIGAAVTDGTLGLPRLQTDFFHKNIPSQGSFDIGAAQYLSASSVVLGVSPEESNSFSFQVYPNPAADQLFVHYDSPPTKPTYLSIYDEIGKEVMCISNVQTNEDSLIPIDGLNNGLFFIKLKTDKTQLTRKFMVQRK